jgi:integrase
MDFNTPFKTGLVNKLKAEKGLSDSSIKMYVRNLEKLNDDMPLKNLNFLKDTEAIVNKLSDYKENTKRGYLISICSALSLDKDTKSKKKLYDAYFKLMVDKNKELKAVEKTNEMTETQKENWIDWKDVEAKLNELKEKVAKFAGAKEINEHNYNTLLSYVILSLYYYKQPRRNLDYQKMIVVKADDPMLPIDKNYLAWDNKEFIFNVFKTSKKEGQQRETIPESLLEIITTYFKFHPYFKSNPISKVKKANNNTGQYFLQYYNGTPLDKVNSITRILNKIFDKSIGSSMLRHSFLSDKHKDTIQTLKEDAEAMGHSVSQALDYVKVKPSDKKNKIV